MSQALSLPAVTWLARGERGVSSNAICQAMTGFETDTTRKWPGNHPHDPADLRRGEWRCPKTYQLMRSIIEGAEAKRA